MRTAVGRSAIVSSAPRRRRTHRRRCDRAGWCTVREHETIGKNGRGGGCLGQQTENEQSYILSIIHSRFQFAANNHGHERLTVTESKTNATPSLHGSSSNTAASASHAVFSGLQPSIASVRTVDLPPAIPFASSSSSSSHHQSQSHIATISGSSTTHQQQQYQAQQQPSPASSSTAELDIDLDSMYMMLEPNLRPATPDPNSRVSQQIYDEHNDLAREYLKVCVWIGVSALRILV